MGIEIVRIETGRREFFFFFGISRNPWRFEARFEEDIEVEVGDGDAILRCEKREVKRV